MRIKMKCSNGTKVYSMCIIIHSEARAGIIVNFALYTYDEHFVHQLKFICNFIHIVNVVK